MGCLADGLIGDDVINPEGVDLGMAEDIVLNPRSNAIAYLVIGRWDSLGVDEKHFAVPWKYFKISAGTQLLELDTSEATMNAGPQVSEDQFAARGDFGEQSKRVDDYWNAHVPP